MSFALNGYIWVVLGIGVRQGRGACLRKTWIKGGSRLWNQHCKMGFGQFSFCFAGCWALCCQLCPWLKMYVRGCSNLCRDGRTSIHLIPPTCILDSRMLQSRPPTWRLLLFSLHREFVNALIKHRPHLMTRGVWNVCGGRTSLDFEQRGRKWPVCLAVVTKPNTGNTQLSRPDDNLITLHRGTHFRSIRAEIPQNYQRVGLGWKCHGCTFTLCYLEITRLENSGTSAYCCHHALKFTVKRSEQQRKCHVVYLTKAHNSRFC